MVHITDPRGGVGIGEASRRTGVPVRTIRFYCDEGILVTHRSSGGHRIFTTDTVARLTQIRRLRAVGLGLSAIAEVLDDEGTARDAVARERVTVETELDALSWRYAVLRALESVSDEQRPAVLALLAGVAERGVARDVLVTFWRRILAAMPPGLFDDFVEMDIPAVPAAPTTDHILVIAELAELARTPEVAHAIARRLWSGDRGSVRDERALVVDLAAAHAQAAQRMFRGDDPEPGPELDLFIAAHASARGARDSPAFRRRLAAAAVDHPAVTRYWALTARAIGTPHTTGATENWLYSALELALESAGS